MTAALLAVVALAAVAPGGWSGSSTHRARTHARVTFDVGSTKGFIQPFVRIDLDGCRSTRTVHLRTILRPIPAHSGRFAAQRRFSPAARAQKVRLRFSGRFTSPTRARGVLRGRLRFAGGHVCLIPGLAWTARPVGLPRDSGAGAGGDDEDLGDAIDDDDEDIDDGDYDEDDTGDDGDDEDPGDDEDEGDDEP